MLVRVEVVPPNKDYIVVRGTDGQVIKLPRKHMQFAKVGDVGRLTTYNDRPKLNLLTDEDTEVIMSSPSRRQMVPYGYFAKPPDPIQTPRG